MKVMKLMKSFLAGTCLLVTAGSVLAQNYYLASSRPDETAPKTTRNNSASKKKPAVPPALRARRRPRPRRLPPWIPRCRPR